MPPRDRFRIEMGALIGGLLVGALASALLTLLLAPVSGDELRRRLHPRVNANPETADPAAERIAEGKAAARRLRAELGLDQR